MPILTYIKLGILAAIVLAFVALGAYAKIVAGERDAALKQVGALQTAAVVNKDTIQKLEKTNAAWKATIDNYGKTLAAVEKNQTEANAHAKELNNVLARHDLTALSLAKPGLIEHRINAGTADVLRLLSVESGANLHN